MSQVDEWNLFIYFGLFQFPLDPFRLLFLFAALNNMGKMTVQLLEYGKNLLMKTLVGKLIFRKMCLRAEKIPVASSLKDELRENERWNYFSLLIWLCQEACDVFSTTTYLLSFSCLIIHRSSANACGFELRCNRLEKKIVKPSVHFVTIFKN